MPKLRDTLGLLQRRRGRDSGGCVPPHLCLERQERGFSSLRELRVRDALAAARLLAGATRRERQPDAARADCRMPGAEGGWREPRTAADLNRNAQPQAREFTRRRARDNARRTRGRAGRRGDLSITGLLGVSWSRERRVRATPGAHLLGPAVQRGAVRARTWPPAAGRARPGRGVEVHRAPSSHPDRTSPADKDIRGAPA